MTRFRDIAELEKGQRQRLLDARLKQFFKDWAPSDSYDAATFHAELIQIVQEIHRESCQTFHDMLSALAARTLSPPFFISKENLP